MVHLVLVGRPAAQLPIEGVDEQDVGELLCAEAVGGEKLDLADEGGRNDRRDGRANRHALVGSVVVVGGRNWGQKISLLNITIL